MSLPRESYLLYLPFMVSVTIRHHNGKLNLKKMYHQEGHQILYSLSFSYLMGFSITNHIDSIYSLPFWKHFKVESILSYNLQAKKRTMLLLPWE